MKTVRWGMIGCGAVTEVKSGPGLYKAQDSQLVAVMGADLAQAKDYAKRHGVKTVYEDAAALINDPEVDIVYVATPPAFHKQYALECTRIGKSIYIEKPMAQTYPECAEIIDACRKTNTRAYVAFYRRGMERFIKVKELIESGAIGALRFVNVMLYQRPDQEDYNRERLPWRLIPQIAGGGKFLDMGIHIIDFLDFACGPIAEVEGKASNQAALYEVEDIVTANWKFASGVQGTGTWCFSAFENFDQVEFVGSAGKIQFAFFSQAPIYLKQAGQGRLAEREFPFTDPRHVQQPFIQSIVDELLGRGKCSGDLASAARASWVCDEILKQYRKKKGFDKLFNL